MQAVSGPLGREQVHFEAPDAVRLGGGMTSFIDWFNAPSSVDPVIKSGLAHFRFVTFRNFSPLAFWSGMKAVVGVSAIGSPMVRKQD